MWLVCKYPGAFPLDILECDVEAVPQRKREPLEDAEMRILEEIGGEKQCRCQLLMLSLRDTCRAALT